MSEKISLDSSDHLYIKTFMKMRIETIYQGLGRVVSSYKRYLSVFCTKTSRSLPQIPIQMERLCYLV